MNKHLKRSIRNGHYEKTDDGAILLPRDGFRIGGVFTHEVRDMFGNLKGEPISDHNLMVNEGLNSLLDVNYAGATQISPWCVGIFKSDSTPAADWTGANTTTKFTETVASTDVTNTDRPDYVEAAAASQSITNSANKATFNINATLTIYGAFLISVDTMGVDGGTMSAASRFSASRSVVATDQLLVTYTITAADA